MASFQKQATLLIFLGVFLLTSVISERVLDQNKIDCYPESGNQTLCESRGCTWEESATKVLLKTAEADIINHYMRTYICE